MENQFGNKIKEIREANALLQRQVASKMEIDTPILSKIERGVRKVKKEQIVQFAKLYKTDNKELLTLWLADQLYNMFQGEPMADEALKSVTKQIKKSK